jgi:hypothetical protein
VSRTPLQLKIAQTLASLTASSLRPAPPPIVDAFACARAIDFLRFRPFRLSLDVPSSHFVRWILQLLDAHPGPETAQILALGVFCAETSGTNLLITCNTSHLAQKK